MKGGRLAGIFLATVFASQKLKQDRTLNPLNEADYGKDWEGICKTGAKQSPIHLDTRFSRPAHFKPFVMENYAQRYKHFNLINTGNNVLIVVPTRLGITLTGGPLKDTFILQNIHWHWKGSEHSIAGTSGLALEMHLMHRNAKYKNLSDALKRTDGVAVLAVLFKVSKSQNSILKKILKQHDEIREPHSHTLIEQTFRIKELLPTNLLSYFTYEGSLTTPPCSESVIWVVFRDILEISTEEVTEYKESLGVTSLSWSGNTPDHNLIKNVWAHMGRRIQNNKPSTIISLKSFFERIWFEEISRGYLEKLYRRVAAVISAKGGTTSY